MERDSRPVRKNKWPVHFYREGAPPDTRLRGHHGVWRLLSHERIAGIYSQFVKKMLPLLY